MSFELSVQKVLLDTLRTSPVLKALGAEIYEHVPQQARLPYLTLGEDTITAFDTSSTYGAEISAKIHTWSLSRTETKRIQSDIRAVLHHAELSIAGYQWHYCYWVNSQSFIDADGDTRHGVCLYHLYITEEN